MSLLSLIIFVIWGILLVFLLTLGSFIKLGTWGNFNCGFSVWTSIISFDGIKLLVVFVVFEIEIVVVVIAISGMMVLLLLIVTVSELVVLYI